MYTTLNKIRDKQPCKQGWIKLLDSLKKTEADDEPLNIISIIDSNGIEDAVWCLRAVEGHDKEIRLFAVWCARQVQHLMTDSRSISALDIAEKFAHGEASIEDLAAAWTAAWTAAGDAAGAAARYAAWAAAGAAAWDAARAADGAAAWDAARAAAGAAAGAAWDAARAAAWDAQEKKLRDICEQINNQEQK